MDATKYNLKEAYNKKLTGKARLHYLENFEHDMYKRRGYAGEYSGNHPKYSKGVAMMGDPNSPMKVMDDDLKYMPVEDIAGQGTEGVNMKTNPINNIKPFKDPGAPKGFKSDADEVVLTAPSYETLEKQIKKGAKSYKDKGLHIQSANVSNEMRDVAYGSNTNTQNLPITERRNLEESLSGSKQGDTIKKFERLKDLRTKRLQSVSMKGSPVKEGHYGGNKGDESRSRRDFAGPSMGHKSPAKMGHKSPVKEQKYGGNKGDLSRSHRDFEGPSMMKSPMKALKFGRR